MITPERGRASCCRICVIPCTASVLWLVLAVMATLFGWGMFIVAALYGHRCHVSLVGYEWLFGAAVFPCAWLGVTGIRRQRPLNDVDRAASENERLVRLLYVAGCAGGALIAIVCVVTFLWFMPPTSKHGNGVPTPTPTPARAWELAPALVARSLHFPSASAAPNHGGGGHSRGSDSDRVAVGALLLIHFGLLCTGLFCYWQYGVNWRIEDARLENGDVFDPNEGL